MLVSTLGIIRTNSKHLLFLFFILFSDEFTAKNIIETKNCHAERFYTEIVVSYDLIQSENSHGY